MISWSATIAVMVIFLPMQWRDFYANGILGGTVPMAVGMAATEKLKGGDGIVFSFMGDGTLGEGVVYESLNIAALGAFPILFVVENNRYAQSTPTRLNLAGEIPDRFKAFGIPVESIDSTDVVEIHEAIEPMLKYVREKNGPAAFVVHTYRFAPHSKGDDSRDPEEIARYRTKDPLPIQAERLDEANQREIQESVEVEVADAFKQAESDPAAEPASLTSPLGRSRVGMALRGLFPVIEIMFGDFISLTVDQLINHAAKFRWMINEQVRVPLVVRTPMGGRRGYVPTHSQSLEKHLLGAPG
jgi:TPP-dependent pyruvate/acetoin dehydrogenase alpha subunit